MANHTSSFYFAMANHTSPFYVAMANHTSSFLISLYLSVAWIEMVISLRTHLTPEVPEEEYPAGTASPLTLDSLSGVTLTL